MPKQGIKSEIDTMYALFHHYFDDPGLSWGQAALKLQKAYEQLYEKKQWDVPLKDENGVWNITISPIFKPEKKKTSKVVFTG